MFFKKNFKGEGFGKGFAPPQTMVIKLNIKEMHFKNVDQ